MKKRHHLCVTSISVLLLISISLTCMPVFAAEEVSEAPSCEHISEWHFADSDECVLCFEEQIIALQTADGEASPCSGICGNSSCLSSNVDEVCADSRLIYSDNYSKATLGCSGCKAGLCDSPCMWLQYVSYMKIVCRECGYSAYAFNSEGTGLAKHYCDSYDYCTGSIESTCDLDADVPEF